MNPLHIGLPIHGADVKDVVNGSRCGRWHFGLIQSKWKGEYGTSAAECFKVFFVFCRDGGNRVEIMKCIDFVGFQAFGQMLQVHALREGLGFFGHQFPNSVFYVVGPEDKRAIAVMISDD